MNKLTKNQENVLKCLTYDFTVLKDICVEYGEIQSTFGYNPNGYVWTSEVSKVLLTLIRKNLVEYKNRGLYKLKSIELKEPTNNLNGVDSVITNRGLVKFTDLIPGDVITGLVGDFNPIPRYFIVSFEIMDNESYSFKECCEVNDIELIYSHMGTYNGDYHKVTIKGLDFKVIQLVYSKYGIGLLELNP